MTEATLRTHTGPTASIPQHLSAMEVMGQGGDTKHLWDKNNEVEVEAARMMFDHLVGEKKFAAFKIKKNGEQGQQVKKFSAKSDGYVFVPPMQGG